MQNIAVYLKFINLYTHNAHNTVSRIVFNQDHEFLSEIYTAVDEAYDSVVERILGLGGVVDLISITSLAVEKLKNSPANMIDNTSCLIKVLEYEKQLCQLIEAEIKSGKLTQGTINMLADIADKSEVRQYKLSRRIKK